MTENHSIIVIGAGISGLLAATELQDQGYDVTVLDKGRGVGGRMSTRRILEGVFDHGAQFFTVREPRFAKLIEACEQAGVVKNWSNGFPKNNQPFDDEGHPRYVGTQGMTSLPKHLAKSLSIETNVKVESIGLNDVHWIINAYNKNQSKALVYEASAVILTAPIPQSSALLHAGNVPLSMNDERVLDKLREYHPSFAVMAVLDNPSKLPTPGGMKFDSGDIAWIADNTAKGISPNQYGITIHASAEYAEENLEANQDYLAQHLLAQAKDFISGDVQEYQIHRWRYCEPKVVHHNPCYAVDTSLPLILAGDAFASPRVEGAAMSGYAAADQLQDMLE